MSDHSSQRTEFPLGEPPRPVSDHPLDPAGPADEVSRDSGIAHSDVPPYSELPPQSQVPGPRTGSGQPRESREAQAPAPAPAASSKKVPAEQAPSAKTPASGNLDSTPHHYVVGMKDPAKGALPDDRTVISRRAPVAAGPFHHPTDLGKSLEGQMLGHFRLEEFVGGGGMGAVFRAVDTMLGRTVAVKVVGSAGTDDDTLRRFRNEAQSAARLDHENIARVYYVGEDAGWNYIVFEFIEGVNIRDLVEHKGPLSLDEAVTYTLQVADALDHASRRDVVHRDIKPSNVLVTADGRAKLVDMGLARLHQVESSSEDLTASGVTLGTFDYISPEQARDPRATDVRSDLYSLGCTFYFMLTGDPPFPHGTVLQKLLSHSSEEPPDPSEYRDDLTEEVVGVINKLLAKNPRDRYQQPRDLIVDLKLLAEHLGLTGATQAGKIWIAPRGPTESFWERHLPWIAPVATLLVAVTLLEVFTRSNNPLRIAEPDITTRVVSAAEAAALSPREPSDVEEAGAAGSASPATTNGGSPANPAGQANSPGTATSPDNVGSPPERTSSGASGMPVEVEPRSAEGSSSTPPTPPVEGDGEGASPPIDSRDFPNDDEPPAGTEPIEPALNAGSRREAPAGRTETPERASSAEAADNGSAAKQVTQLVVGPESVEIGEDERRVDSLREAVALAGELAAVDSIELRFDGEHVVQPPLVFGTTLLARDGFRVRAAEGHSPVVVFRPQAAQLGDAQRPRMIRVGQGGLRWVGVHVAFDLPLDDRQAWSLFYLDRVQSLHVEQATLTIRNRHGAMLDDRVAFFEMAPPAVANGMDANELTGQAPPPATRPPVTNLSLLRVAARGQATLVRAERSRPLQLSWQQGFLSSTQRLLDMGGLKDPPEFEEGIVSVDLRQVTALVGPGLCRLRTDMNHTHQRNLLANFVNCLFVFGESAAPVFEYDGTLNLEEVRARLNVSGSGNYYDNTKIILRVRTLEAPDFPSDVTLSVEDRARAAAEGWYREIEPQPASMLNLNFPSPREDPSDVHRRSDFAVELNGNSMDMALPGFQLESLPEFPAAPSAETPESEPPETSDVETQDGQSAVPLVVPPL